MACETAVATDCDVFSANLDALHVRAPLLADRLAKIAIPQSVVASKTRDGTTSFRIGDSADDWHWLGRTSMPTVRAAALIDQFKPDAGNILVPAMGNGMEVCELLRRIRPHCAVFVVESDPLDLRLALTLRDYGDLIRTGRLIFVDGPDPCDALVALFDESPGLEFPGRILALPYLETRAVESLKGSMERAAQRIAQDQHQRITASGTALRVRTGVVQKLQYIGIVTVDPRPAVLDVAGALQAAANACGVAVGVCAPDRPDRCHWAARLAHLSDHNADAALLLNCGWAQLREHVPDAFPAVTWLLPDAGVLGCKTDGFGKNHVVFAASPQLQRKALSAGVDPNRVHLLEVAADDSVYRPLDAAEQGPAAGSFDVVCIADIADLRPEACGIRLTSHQQLWKCICEQAANRRGLEAAHVLANGERDSGVVLSDPPAREELLNLIRNRLIPTLLARESAESLNGAGIDVRVCGTGWQFSKIPADRVLSFPISPNEKNILYNRCRIVLCPVQTNDAVQTSLDAITAGRCVLVRSPVADLHQTHPQLAEVLTKIPMFEATAELPTRVRRLLRDERQRYQACARARTDIADGHLFKHRLAVLRDSLAELRHKP